MSIIDTLRKLIAHQKSAERIGSEAEAAAFASKVQELLEKHHLEMADVDVEIEDDGVTTETVLPDDFGLPRRRIRWFEILAAIVARSHFCETAIWRGTGRSVFTLIGRAVDREIAKFMIVYLSRAGRSLCEFELQRMRLRGRRIKGRAWRHSFLDAFAAAIALRYHAQMAATRSLYSGDALMVIDRARKDVADFAANPDRFAATKPLARSLRFSPLGALLGRHHGNEIDLQKKPLSGSSPRGLIGATGDKA
jgi:hypothetical protein